tara:strand:+ start:950 stop:1060 length:111 start_codon:yes stop_codon:yes gene_type:complete
MITLEIKASHYDKKSTKKYHAVYWLYKNQDCVQKKK